jgi:uncharacterized DUF497 family protein
MLFEFDMEKSRANKAKHGIDFVAAQAIWKDPRALEIPARTIDEPRSMVIGMIHRILWSAVVTYRDGRVRLISVRRARREETVLYESKRL